jgi:hypothetical protein
VLAFAPLPREGLVVHELDVVVLDDALDPVGIVEIGEPGCEEVPNGDARAEPSGIGSRVRFRSLRWRFDGGGEDCDLLSADCRVGASQNSFTAEALTRMMDSVLPKEKFKARDERLSVTDLTSALSQRR